MDEKQFRERLNKLLAEERKNPLRWWYISYATKERFLGAVYIEAHGPAEAAFLSNHHGYNPGGEAMMLPVPDEAKLPEVHFLNRLLTKEEIIIANPGEDCMTIAEFEAEQAAKENE